MTDLVAMPIGRVWFTCAYCGRGASHRTNGVMTCPHCGKRYILEITREKLPDDCGVSGVSVALEVKESE